MKNLLLFVIAVLVCSCHTANEKGEMQSPPNQITAASPHDHAHNNGVCPDDYKSMENMSLIELREFNRNMWDRIRDDYRSWSYSEPERWPALADKFADNVIYSCPEAASRKKEIARFFVDYLKKRAEIYHSDAKNKQALMGQSSTELKYNLSFLIGVEAYRKWELDSKNQIVHFKQKQDSLKAGLALNDKKILELEKQQKP